MTTATELKDRILSRADEDSDFRARLIADPNTAIADEIGMSLPGGFEVAVHEDSATTCPLGVAALAAAQPGRVGDGVRRESLGTEGKPKQPVRRYNRDAGRITTRASRHQTELYGNEGGSSCQQLPK
jgi:hypothetical protein